MRCTCPEKLLVDPYSDFDRICSDELKNPIKAHAIINISEFSTFIPKGYLLNDAEDTVNLSDYLAPIRGQHGVYHLWHPEGMYCAAHDLYRLECAYVGKGLGDLRIKDHFKDKYREDAQVAISFYRCSNRIAKYLEQLFLDNYKFDINHSEMNRKGQTLYAFWMPDRYNNLQETHRLAEFSAMKGSDI